MSVSPSIFALMRSTFSESLANSAPLLLQRLVLLCHVLHERVPLCGDLLERRSELEQRLQLRRQRRGQRTEVHIHLVLQLPREDIVRIFEFLILGYKLSSLPFRC